MLLPYRQQLANKVTSRELRQKQEQYVYLDVREADEIEEGMIDGAVNIPLGLLIRKARHGDLHDLRVRRLLLTAVAGTEGILRQMS